MRTKQTIDFCARMESTGQAFLDKALGRTWAKLDQEKKLVIGYFGGSITEGAGASDPSSCWRSLTTAWFRQQFPGAQITEINAAIGGTGSDLGAFRCRRDLLDHHPDLVFVEFAVNDATASLSTRPLYYEGVIRQILTTHPQADIVMVYTTSKAAETYSQGTVPPAVASEQAIADHYQLPSVNIGKILWQAIQEGKGTWESLTQDGIHPNDHGYRIYADAMISFLQSHCNDRAIPRGPFPAPLHSKPVENSSMIDAWIIDAPGWAREDQTLAGRYPHRIATNVPGTELTFPFEGAAFGLYWLMAPDSGWIEWSIDNGPVKTTSAWDKYCLTFTRANFELCAEGLSPGPHLFHLKVSDRKDAASTGNWIRIGALLFH